MNNPHTANYLSTLIQKQALNATELQKLLEQEQQLLVNDQNESLLVTIEKKEALAEQMATTQQQMVTLAQQADPEQPQQSLVETIQSIDPSGELFNQWNALLEITRACKQLNEANGSTINLKKRYADNGLAILRGQTGSNNTATYSKKGLTYGKHGSRVINKA